ncbi:MAG: hypothetical protein MMC33_010017 [Icmadophila ericetorum]|nr:hypothetical protein [Icmadophila ericetorum]
MGSLFEDENSSRAGEADRWFNSLDNETHKLFERLETVREKARKEAIAAKCQTKRPLRVIHAIISTRHIAKRATVKSISSIDTIPVHLAPSHTKYKPSKERPVKIAILDMGVDGKHLSIQSSRRRIKAYKSWVDHLEECNNAASSDSKVMDNDVNDHNSQPNIDITENNAKELIGTLRLEDMSKFLRDDYGHGTHSVGLLFKVNPWAHIYIARIARKNKGTERVHTDPKYVLEAIEYARDKWQVNVVTMSFGWDLPTELDSDIETAINKAIDNNGILSFAAASNEGAKTSGPAFPARLPRAFYITSTSGKGALSDFNTPGAQGSEFNHSIVGEAVKSCWPGDPGQPDGERRQTGTSIATPMAAAIASLLLTFATDQLLEDYVKAMKKPKGMCHVFDLLNTKDSHKGYLVPWHLLRAGWTETDTNQEVTCIRHSIEHLIRQYFHIKG